MSLGIRQADTKDIDAVFGIEQLCFEYPWSRVLFEADLTSNPNAVYWLAEDENGEALGFIGTHNIAGEINVTNVAVKPTAQNRKIATALVSHMIEYFVDKNIIGITLEVASKNESAIHLYEKSGFKREGLRARYYKNGDDAIIMWFRYENREGCN
ncbi:MAG: ribosomal protein S18-alanine N-acetyltransferase [Firmicutes bacterium]|nr:ribosomal protein S18-alanine N-acetyltransferase [Bacillota bacterium]